MFPFPPLLTATGITLGQIGGQQSDDAPGGVAELCRRFQVSKKVITRWRTSGLTETEADRAAGALGLHPMDLWPTEWARLLELDLLAGTARVNAAKTTCPQGHAYTHTDSRGKRCCRYCHTDKVRQIRTKPQVTTVVTVQMELFAC